MSDLQTEPRCDGCRFWVQFDNDVGDCRRYAPRPADAACRADVVEEDSSDPLHPVWPFAVWPVSRNGDWCGEFEAKAPPGAPATLAVRRPKGGRP